MIRVLCPICRKRFEGLRCSCGYTAKQIEGFGMALPQQAILADRYVVQYAIGAGGFGITYLATDTLNRTVCAIKEYVPVGVAVRESDYSLKPDVPSKNAMYIHAEERFMQEAATLKRMNYIPETVKITDYFQENNTAYFVMEYIDGRTLKSLVVQNGKIPAKQAISIITTVANGLERIHNDAGIFHRDISPENIMISKKGTVKIIDFGSAKTLARQQNQNFTVVLKSGYAPPEQYSSRTPQGRYTDVYALASTLYYAVTGVSLPDAPSRAQGVTYTPLCKMGVGIPVSISDAVDRALDFNRASRTQTMAAFARELGYQPATPAVSRREDRPTEVITPALKTPTGPVLEVFYGDTKKTWQLTPDVTIAAGRQGYTAGIALPANSLISKTHFYVCYDSDRKKFLIKDVSINGIQCNKKRLLKGRLYTFDINTVLEIAKGVCLLRMKVY